MINRQGVKTIAFFYIVLYALIMMIVGLLSCSPSKQAAKHYNKAKEKHLPTVALLSQNDWPCGVSSSDTVIKFLAGKKDTINVPQKVIVPCPQLDSKGDTIYVETEVEADCKCEDAAPDTLYKEVVILEKDPRDSIALKEQQELTQQAESKTSTWQTVAWIFIGLFAIGLIVIIIKIFK